MHLFYVCYSVEICNIEKQNQSSISTLRSSYKTKPFDIISPLLFSPIAASCYKL